MIDPVAPEPSDCKRCADPRRQALDEWEAIQVLCESLALSGGRPRSLLLVAPPPPAELRL